MLVMNAGRDDELTKKFENFVREADFPCVAQNLR